MSIHIKSPEEIAKMRIACRMVADALDMIGEYVKPGVTTDELNTLVHDYIVTIQNAYPASLGYHGFPKSMCTSVNHVVCHGIPSDKMLKDGDIINIDILVKKDGFHGDSSKMFLIGDASIKAKRLVEVTYDAMWRGIHLVKPGARLGDLGAAIQRYAEFHNFSVVREYCGHGVGKVIHEPEIQVLHYGEPGTGLILEPGMTFTIEPMINAGKRQIKLLPDKWTVVTKDHSLSAQWEHTILVTEEGYEVLTLRADERAQMFEKAA
ncbi:MAG: type I methionyl aminopeptidase [Gammaproteobacteria bacterium]|nr:type I methionyl aminopeptidase [Gammaproteobacteria bacterium]